MSSARYIHDTDTHAPSRAVMCRTHDRRPHGTSSSCSAPVCTAPLKLRQTATLVFETLQSPPSFHLPRPNCSSTGNAQSIGQQRSTCDHARADSITACKAERPSRASVQIVSMRSGAAKNAHGECGKARWREASSQQLAHTSLLGHGSKRCWMSAPR